VTWADATTLPGGRVLLYDPPTGQATVVSIDGDELSAADPVDALPAGVILIGPP
jgi:hypothetical protein